MSVLYPSELAAAWWLDTPPRWARSTCGDATWPPAVYWVGAVQLFWHPGCAANLGPRVEISGGMSGGLVAPLFREIENNTETTGQASAREGGHLIP